MQPAAGEERDYDRRRRVAWVIWPSFIVAAVCEMLFFAVIDPGEIVFFGSPVELSATAAYSLFFFFFWAMGALSSGLTCFLQRSPFEVNRCPVPPERRPGGCSAKGRGGCCD